MCLSTQKLKQKKQTNKQTKKQRVNLEPPRPMAARLITKKQQKYNNRILEVVIAHLQDAGHPKPYSKFSSSKNGSQYCQT